MIDFFIGLNPYLQTILASLVAFLFTVAGSLLVFIFKNVNKTLMNVLLAISSGIMLSAGIFSLLLPAIEQSKVIGMPTIYVVSLSILIGSLILILIEKYFEVRIKDNDKSKSNIILLVLSILLHNIPEGMSIGVAFASVTYGIDGATVASAISLSLGIAIQNFPEGSAVAIPLRKLGLSRMKSFVISVLTGSIEIASALIGAVLVLKIKLLFPFLLSFAAGAMILVVIEELIPEALNHRNKSLMAYMAIIGFILMMIMEI